uniref:Gag1-like clamp domain-containing protein n=1 Tax=Physcomitrium patens TaxID=3218 RepID=A0A2K1JD29_PHYPA|nr:hypothetical protein PHYPA_019711 [Physcomitrium patens]
MFSMLDWFWLIKLSILCMRCMYGCGNCFGRFTKSQKLDLRTTQDFLGADIGEAVPLNNPLGTSSSNEMENNGSNSCQQRPSSSIDANHLSLEAHSPAENDVNSPYVNHALRRWTEERREWLGNRERPRPKRHREPVIRKWWIFLLMYGSKKVSTSKTAYAGHEDVLYSNNFKNHLSLVHTHLQCWFFYCIANHSFVYKR